MKKCIIVSGVYASGVGLSNVMVNLIHYLSASFRIVCIGFDPGKTDNEVDKKEISGCDVYVYPVSGTANLYKIERPDIESYIDQYNPICVVTLGPIMFNRYLLAILQQYRSSVKVVSYISVEGQLVDVNFLKYVHLIDFCVFYTASVNNDFNKLILENPFPGNGLSAVRSGYIGHGVDKQKFYPIPAATDKERRKKSREIIYKDYPVDEHSFVVLNMNRPSHRKKIEATIEGFKLFAGGKENVYLHLHIGTTERAVREKYYHLVEAAGLKEQVIITPEPGELQVKSEDWLNILYNSCDVGISTSKGEGWGLGLFEHAATKAAILAPGHTSFIENWQNAALLMPCSEKQFVFYEYCDMFIVSPEEVCRSLNSLYFDRDLLDKVSADCFNRMHESKFDWENVADKFRQIILDVAGETDMAQTATVINTATM